MGWYIYSNLKAENNPNSPNKVLRSSFTSGCYRRCRKDAKRGSSKYSKSTEVSEMSSWSCLMSDVCQMCSCVVWVREEININKNIMVKNYNSLTAVVPVAKRGSGPLQHRAVRAKSLDQLNGASSTWCSMNCYGTSMVINLHRWEESVRERRRTNTYQRWEMSGRYRVGSEYLSYDDPGLSMVVLLPTMVEWNALDSGLWVVLRSTLSPLLTWSHPRLASLPYLMSRTLHFSHPLGLLRLRSQKSQYRGDFHRHTWP